MMKHFFSLLFLLIAFEGVGQKSLEVSLLSRFDQHGEYTSRYFNNAATSNITLSGLSYGLNVSYLQPVLQKLKVQVGVGYYRLGINNITASNQWGTPPARTIDYRHPAGIEPLFSTDKYHYNNLNLLGGILFATKFHKSVSLTLGADMNIRYSYSQQYHLNYDDIKYRASNGKSCGFGVNSYVGFLKPIRNNQYYINPKIILSLVQRIKGDKAFGEDESLKINRNFSGYGLAIAVGKYL